MAFETRELADRAVEVALEQLNPMNALQAFIVANEYSFSTLRYENRTASVFVFPN
jgi:hypothetical protein